MDELVATGGGGAGADTWRLWDESRLLSSHERGDLEKRLAAAARRLASPVFILLVERLRHETAGELATRSFTARRLAGTAESANPVLLVVAVHDRAAAIETGKSNAGIVPELDAREIAGSLRADLAGHVSLGRSLTHALDAIVTSAEATADRRRPSPPSEDDPPAPDAPAPPDGSASAATANDATYDAAAADADPAAVGSADQPNVGGKPRGRSRLPIAAAIGVLILVALAIRRRRTLSASSASKPDRPSNLSHDRLTSKPPRKPRER